MPILDGSVFVNHDERIHFLYSDLLQTLLYKKAFIVLAMNTLPISGMYTSKDDSPRLDCVREALSNITQLEWYSDSVGIAAHWGQGMLFARQYTGYKCWVRISGESKTTVNAIAKTICSPCNVSFDLWA